MHMPGFSKGLSPLLSSLTSISSSTHASRPALLRPAAAARPPPSSDASSCGPSVLDPCDQGPRCTQTHALPIPAPMSPRVQAQPLQAPCRPLGVAFGVATFSCPDSSHTATSYHCKAACSRPFPPWLWPRLVRLKDFRQKEQEGPPGATHKTSPGISRLLPGLAKATTTRNPVEDRTVDTLPAPQCPSALNPATGSPASRPPVPSCGARAFTATGTPNARSHGTGWTQRFWTGPPLE
ncbi:uncharacterized protein LOC104851785 isoform X3 [Fukomys damarensis]|uniref:uncharacterized protein LOC104851785 isoform X3 n=1 Tax=Fukomys damarensis TaxID=885580 RepID=UPI00053FF2BB|nr:uncharacterized protein LOC104851785 isoform X3 [Fukomys damarensis]